MYTLHGQNRRFWLPQSQGSLIRLGVVLLVIVLVILLGIFIYQNAFTTGILVVSCAIVVGWLLQRPRKMLLELSEKELKINTRTYTMKLVESWSLLDLDTMAQLNFKIRGVSQGVEIYVEKEELADSGLVNFLTDAVPFNPDTSAISGLYVILRALDLY